MKNAIILFFIALVVGAGVNALAYSISSYSIKPGLTDIDESPPAGTMVQEGMIPETKVIDGYRPMTYLTRVRDGQGQTRADFPMGGASQ